MNKPIHIGQNLFNALEEICGFTAIDDEMRQIIHAIIEDNPPLKNKAE